MSKKEKTDVVESEYLRGDAICLNCKYRWIANAPVGFSHFRCPECELDKGVYQGLIIPDRGLHCCHCGCKTFVIELGKEIDRAIVSCSLCGLFYIGIPIEEWEKRDA